MRIFKNIYTILSIFLPMIINFNIRQFVIFLSIRKLNFSLHISLPTRENSKFQINSSRSLSVRHVRANYINFPFELRIVRFLDWPFHLVWRKFNFSIICQFHILSVGRSPFYLHHWKFERRRGRLDVIFRSTFESSALAAGCVQYVSSWRMCLLVQATLRK